jgi:hypothetical protein
MRLFQFAGFAASQRGSDRGIRPCESAIAFIPDGGRDRLIVGIECGACQPVSQTRATRVCLLGIATPPKARLRVPRARRAPFHAQP